MRLRASRAASTAALCSGEAFNAILRELRSLWEAVVQFAGADRVKVDLGMMHRTDYYTGMILRGYLSGYGEEILSGGRYDVGARHQGETGACNQLSLHVFLAI